MKEGKKGLRFSRKQAREANRQDHRAVVNYKFSALFSSVLVQVVGAGQQCSVMTF